MGVVDLTKFIHDRQNVHGGVFYINIIEEIRKYKRTMQKDPLIIFDFSPLQHIQNETAIEVLSGLRWQKIVDKIKILLKLMAKEGAQLVFFLEAPTQDEQEENWLKRKTNQYRDDCMIVNDIKNGKLLSTIMSHNQKSSPSVVGPYLKQELKKIGKWIKVYDTDVDLAIAQYANDHKAFAIFTDDSDFLVYVGFYRLWKIREIDFDNLTTKEFSRVNLRRALKLSPCQMPLFSTLCGNDVVHFTDLNEFHAKCPVNQSKQKWIAEFTRQHPPIQSITKTDIERIARMIDCSANKIGLSLQQYDLTYRPKVFVEKEPLLRQLKEFECQTLYIILKGFSNRIGPIYEAINEPTFAKSQTELSLRIYRCIMGILLQHKQDKNNNDTITCPIYSVRDHEKGYEKHHISPIYPHIKVPPLKDLIFHGENESNINLDRLHLLKWAINCPTLNLSNLFCVEPVFVPIILTLCYLVKEAKFTIKEADSILLMFYDSIYRLIPDDVELPSSKKFQFRAFQACWTYIAVQNGIMELLYSLGLKQFAVYAPFDGVHFHYIYNSWIDLHEIVRHKSLSVIRKMRWYKNI